MRRKRCDEIMQFLHLVDNSKINSDRYYKVRPLFKAVNETFKQLPLQPNISIDKSMLKYYGKHSTKQLIRGRLIRFGFKLFSLSSPTGCLYPAESYCGSDTHLKEEFYGLGGNVALTLTQYCNVPAGSRLYFDNWFTSLSLLDRLKSDGIGGTATIRADRCEKAPVQSKKELEKKGRSSFSYASNGKKNMQVRWCDNSVVSVASNCTLTGSKKLVPRWSRQQKKTIDVTMPEMVHTYNRNMGGVDLFDQFVANYRIRIRSKKWWWPFLS